MKKKKVKALKTGSYSGTSQLKWKFLTYCRELQIAFSFSRSLMLFVAWCFPLSNTKSLPALLHWLLAPASLCSTISPLRRRTPGGFPLLLSHWEEPWLLEEQFWRCPSLSSPLDHTNPQWDVPIFSLCQRTKSNLLITAESPCPLTHRPPTVSDPLLPTTPAALPRHFP